MPDRCFVALELPERALPVLGRARTLISEAAPSWRDEKWVAPELLHVTVAFIGAVSDPAWDGVLAALTSAAGEHRPVTLVFDGARAVPDRRHAQMMWATLHSDPSDLGPLRDALLRACAVAPDQRPFRPHVTLVRARRPRAMPASATALAARWLSDAGKAVDGAMSVPSLTVYSSTLGACGPTYRSLARLPLSGGSGTGRND